MLYSIEGHQRSRGARTRGKAPLPSEAKGVLELSLQTSPKNLREPPGVLERMKSMNPVLQIYEYVYIYIYIYTHTYIYRYIYIYIHIIMIMIIIHTYIYVYIRTAAPS